MNPQLSVIIPVLDESQIINQTLNHLLERPSSRHAEIIVVDGSPQRNTIKVISHAGIKKVAAQKGRGTQMNQGARMATGDILLFLHADTCLEKGALKNIAETSKRGDIVGGAFHLGIRSEKKAFRIIEMAVKVRTRITRIPYGDQAIFLKRDRFCQIHGFKEIPIMEDVELMQRIKKRGWKIAILPQRAYTSPRRWFKEGIFHCTYRNWLIMLLYLMGASPHRLSQYYP
jgi:rSAM/selenodomain-associated transferase 2